jgi:putative endonuclease
VASEEWVVYIVETASGRLYTGISTDVDRRIAEHGSSTRGAKFFRLDPPRRIVYREPAPDRAAACRREREIKALRRRDKLRLIRRRPLPPVRPRGS